MAWGYKRLTGSFAALERAYQVLEILSMPPSQEQRHGGGQTSVGRASKQKHQNREQGPARERSDHAPLAPFQKRSCQPQSHEERNGNGSEPGIEHHHDSARGRNAFPSVEFQEGRVAMPKDRGESKEPAEDHAAFRAHWPEARDQPNGENAFAH